MSDPTKLFLFRRNNGVYYLGYFQDGRKLWKSTRCTRKSDALKALTNFRRLFKPQLPAVSLSKFIALFISYAEANYSKATVNIYRSALNRLLSLVGDCALASVTPQHLDSYKTARLRGEGAVSPVSVNIELRTLRAAFNVAVRWQMLESNPFSRLQQVRTPDVPPSYFTREEFQKLLSVVKENWLREIIVFAVLTGMRRGEIVNLRWQDVDLQRKVIHIRSNGTFTTKHGKSRTVPMSEALYHLLSSKVGRSACEYVFSLHGRKIMEGWVSHKFKYYVYDLRFNDDKLHFHSLRHTFASWLVQDGVSLYEVQKLLGHSSIVVTQVYSHLQPEQLHAAVNRIEVSLN